MSRFVSPETVTRKLIDAFGKPGTALLSVPHRKDVFTRGSGTNSQFSIMGAANGEGERLLARDTGLKNRTIASKPTAGRYQRLRATQEASNSSLGRISSLLLSPSPRSQKIVDTNAPPRK